MPCASCSHRISQWVKHAAAHATAPAASHPWQQPATPRYGRSAFNEDSEDDEQPQQQQQQQVGFRALGRPASALSSATGDEIASAGQEGMGGAADAEVLGVLPDGSEQEEDLAVDAR
jgi:hypothetical protein